MFLECFIVLLMTEMGFPQFEDCSDVDGVVKSVKMENCTETDLVCEVNQNVNTSVNITFKSPTDAETLATYMVLYNKQDVRERETIDLPNTDGCQDSGISCPISENETYTITIPYTIDYVPEGDKFMVNLIVDVPSDDDKEVFCVKKEIKPVS